MPKRRASEISRRNYSELSEDEDSEEEDHVFIPDPDDSGSDGDSSNDDGDRSSDDGDNSDDVGDSSDDNEVFMKNVSYKSIANNYTEKQKKLEPNHEFSWSNEEKVYSEDLENEVLLSDAEKQKIAAMSPVQLFELFFSIEIKNYIIEASKENGLELSEEEFNTFVGILLLSSYNIRNNQKEYWENDPLVKCTAVTSAMSRNRFLEIKSKIKYSKSTDKNDVDKACKVRHILELFKKNIQQFGFFSTALSVDEMMVRFFGRTCLKQYLPSKPDPYGIKLWALCGAIGYIFNVDIYCGKNDPSIGINLSSCPLGSRVVLQMVSPLLHGLSKRKLSTYHLYFDNYFTSPDLVIHLNKCGLQSTGTVRRDRVKEKHAFQKKAPRGSYIVSQEQNSGMNFISLIDSKEVSVLSTAAGVTPLKPMDRYSKTEKARIDIDFPSAVALYNKYMGGVDAQDFRCKKVYPSIKSKKWTYNIFVRIMQMSIVNAVILWNLCKKKGQKKMKTRELCREVSRKYLSQSKLGNFTSHKHESKKRASCDNGERHQRTTRFCTECDKYYCVKCFPQIHSQ